MAPDDGRPGWGNGRPTRGRMSRIDRLEPELKELLDELLRSGVPQREIVERLREPLEARGEKPISTSSLNRYATRMESVGRHIRESREVADAWIARLGQQPTGELGQLIVEIVRTLTFQTALRGAEADPDDPEAALDARTLGDLALAAQRLERAAEIGRKREAAIREAAAREAAAAARQAGASQSTEDAIMAALLGRSA